MAVRNGAMAEPVDVTKKVAAASATSIATLRASVTAFDAGAQACRLRPAKLAVRERLHGHRIRSPAE